MDVEQRARFESWCPYDPEKNEDGLYLWERTRIAWGAWQAALTPPDADMGNPISVPDGFVLVPVEPTPGLLMSMAIRGDHALGCPGYYDQEMFTAGGHVGHQRILEVAISEARKQHEEVVGTGFYTPEKEAGYAAMLAARPEVKP